MPSLLSLYDVVVIVVVKGVLLWVSVHAVVVGCCWWCCRCFLLWVSYRCVLLLSVRAVSCLLCVELLCVVCCCNCAFPLLMMVLCFVLM